MQEVPGTADLLQLLSPALHSLHIVFRSAPTWDHRRRGDYQAFVETLLTRAAERTPSLTYLRITRGNGILEEWLHPVSRFERVEVLDILEPTYDLVTTNDLLPGLGAMEHLRSLKLRLPATLRFDGATRSFAALRTLHLWTKFASLHDAIRLLRSVSSPHLESVHVDGCECETAALAEALHELCTVLHAGFARTLRTVSLSVTPIGSPVVFDQPLVKYVEPLLKMRELAEVRLHLASKNVYVGVTEPDFAALAEAWLRLELLDLDYVPADGSAPSLRTLVPFARCCPSLVEMRLPRIDARDVGVEVAAVPPHRSLRSFSVSDGGWDSLIPEPEGFACFLKRLFPSAVLGQPRLAAEQWSRTVDAVKDSLTGRNRGYCSPCR